MVLWRNNSFTLKCSLGTTLHLFTCSFTLYLDLENPIHFLAFLFAPLQRIAVAGTFGDERRTDRYLSDVVHSKVNRIGGVCHLHYT